MTGLTDDILGVFRDRDVRALFVTEITGALGMPVPAIDEGCAELVGKSALMLVENTFPDPHLAGVDLRIAALIAPPGSAGQGSAAALDAARSCWQTWLTEFLGSHRCQ
jgi:hypothetical protein